MPLIYCPQHSFATSCKRVPKGGLEPPRPCGQRILSPLRLPIPPLGLNTGLPPDFIDFMTRDFGKIRWTMPKVLSLILSYQHPKPDCKVYRRTSLTIYFRWFANQVWSNKPRMMGLSCSKGMLAYKTAPQDKWCLRTSRSRSQSSLANDQGRKIKVSYNWT